MVTKNLNKEVGLINGARVIVKELIYKGDIDEKPK
jgi:hypothetical protein